MKKIVLNKDKRNKSFANIVLEVDDSVNIDGFINLDLDFPNGIAGKNRTIRTIKDAGQTIIKLTQADGINLFWVDGGVFYHKIAGPSNIRFDFGKKPIYVFSFTYTEIDDKDRLVSIKKTAFVVTKDEELLVTVSNVNAPTRTLDRLHFRYYFDSNGKQRVDAIPDYRDSILLAMGE